MKTLLLILAGIAGMNSVLMAQSAGSYLYNNPQSFNDERAVIALNNPSGNTVNLKAEVLMNVKATSYTAIFAATQSGPDAPAVDSIMALRIQLVRYGLVQLGVPEKDIHIDAVSMVPTYTYKLEEKKYSRRATEVPIGFEIKKNIHVLFREQSQLDGIISQMALADIYDLVKVEYNIDGAQTYLEELREAALSVIETKKKIYPALGMHLEVAALADGFNITYPMERYKSFTAVHSGTTYSQLQAFASLNSTSISVNGSNNSVRLSSDAPRDYLQQQFILQSAEKSKTIFYDRVPYNQFDKVIHADTEEPCIQLYYTLQVTFALTTEEQHQALLKARKQQEEAQALAAGKRQRRARR